MANKVNHPNFLNDLIVGFYFGLVSSKLTFFRSSFKSQSENKDSDAKYIQNVGRGCLPISEIYAGGYIFWIGVIQAYLFSELFYKLVGR